ncbi:MFS transporter [Streptosporangium nondiastaticum]|uniref:MFS transporter n=1 Tax=Streptosporangium nondiastaticum TaxID=35764 RepID=A0A9X7JNQ1_9ACTN|nr:MFS transporter [Streptosporangium nondiastaticum]PSJ26908.1 MFS transporter [Streptosporangium nondiastaticum]
MTDPITRVRVPARPEAALFTRTAVAASCAGFVLIGALQSLYGPAIPALREEFGLSPSAAGLGLSAHFAGGVTGVLAFNRIHGRTGNRVLLGSSYALMALGSIAFALAPAWPLALVAALVAGFGFGGIDYGLNQLFATGFGRRSTAMLNVLNAHFGIGAVAGPALVGLLGPGRYPVAFLACGALAAGLLLFLKGVRDREPAPAAGNTDRPPAPPPRPGRTVLLLGAFVLLYVVHVGVEAGVGGWEPTHLETVGYTTAAAASATSVYWLMLTAGRFLVVPLAVRLTEPVIVAVSCAGMLLCTAAAAVPALAPYAYAGVGLFIAPVFPTGLPWLHRTVPTARRAAAYVIAASMVGGVAAGPALGRAIELSGVRAVPVVLCAMTAVCLLATVWLARATRPPRLPGPRRQHPARPCE